MELNPKGMLMQRLDAGLQAKAEELMAPRDKEGHPLIGNIYALQCIAEMHIYLRTVHEFRPEEISDLLYFEDPLRVAQHCWKENTDIYAFRISDLIKKYNLREVYPAAKPPVKGIPEKPSGRSKADGTGKQSQKGHREKRYRERRNGAKEVSPTFWGNLFWIKR